MRFASGSTTALSVTSPRTRTRARARGLVFVGFARGAPTADGRRRDTFKTGLPGLPRAVGAPRRPSSRSSSPHTPPRVSPTMLATASTTYAGAKVAAKTTTVTKRANVITRAGQYDDELLQTAVRASFAKASSSKASSKASRGRDRDDAESYDSHRFAIGVMCGGMSMRMRTSRACLGGNIRVILRVVCIRSHRRPVALASTRVATV